jgi:hypothetical protein
MMMGNRRIDELMIPVSEAISRHITNEAAATISTIELTKQ